MRADRRRIMTGLAGLATGIAGCGLSGRVAAQGFAGMGSDAAGFTLPRPGKGFSFPRDHGPHPDFRIEWWYVTANLEAPDGAACGIQWTLFRTALRPGEESGWSSPQVWFAHAGMTRAAEHRTAERFARGGIGQAGATADPFEAWIDDWAMTGRAGATADALSAVDLRARGDDFGYDLRLRADGPLVFHGDAGFSVKHERGQASYYYSQPHYAVTGTLDWPDGPVPVTGRAWLDREWSSQPLDGDQTGWDWFSLHLGDGTKLMIYRLRERGGGGYVPGTWIHPDGQSESIADGEVRLEALEITDIDGRQVPTVWRVQIPGRGVDLTTRPVYAQAWMPLSVAYWEGPVAVSGSHDGVGYLEMTGYD